MTQSMYMSIRAHALEHERQTAVVFYGRRISRSRMLKLIDRLAGGLEDKGLRHGDIVTACMPNSPQAAILLYALNKLGVIVNLVHPLSPPSQLLDSANATSSKLIVTYDVWLGKFGDKFDTDIPIVTSHSGAMMDLIHRVGYLRLQRGKLSDRGDRLERLMRHAPSAITHEFTPDEPAIFLPSGGSTGKPKIIMLSNEAFNGLCRHAQFFLSKPISNYRAMYSVLPIFHGFGLCMNLHMCMVQGITNVMTLKFNPEDMAKAIEREKVDILTGVPTMYSKLLGCKRFCTAKLGSIKDCFIGGDNAPVALIEQFNELLRQRGSSAQTYVGYGLTETVTVCAVNTRKHYEIGSIGYPLPDTRIRIVKDGIEMPTGEVGEIVISTPLIMRGYFGTDESPVREWQGEKWLFTGDYGYMSQGGFIYFKQRMKNMIKVSGVPVFPSEVEAVAESVEGVVYAAAVGKLDEMRGETVRLYIEARGDHAKIHSEIMQLAKDKLLTYAVPSEIIFVDRMPLTAIGKIDRKQLDSSKLN